LLRREAQIENTMGYSGSCVIDYALICYGFAPDMSYAACSALAKSTCATVIPDYSHLGLTVLMLPMRSMMKIGPEPFALIQLMHRQLDKIGRTCREAIA
jgi:hypothetical protein